jgi:hypothetical protein
LLGIRCEAGSLTTTLPFASNPTITIRCPFVPYPAPGRSPFLNDSDAINGIPAAMNCSASVSDRSRVTNPSTPRLPAYAVLKGQFPAPSYA